MKEPKEKTLEQLQAELAAAEAKAEALKAENDTLNEVVAGQNAELEKQGDAKKFGKPVITVNKKKYKVLVPKCRIELDGKLVTVVTTELDKKENKHLFDAILAIEGQTVLEEV